MEKYDNLNSQYFKYIDQCKAKSSNLNIWNWLNADNLGAIILDTQTKVYWIEKGFGRPMPNYIFKNIKQWCKKLGYQYLYDVAPVK